MSAPASHDELHDLSQEDAQELRAFLDKRKWFEAKLKLLEALPPVYPFVLPTISAPGTDSTSSSPIYEDEAQARWKLPSAHEIIVWQKERAVIEEETFAFDGGDLVRIKNMTRAATLLPLTPPSTHLVSITLALVVLIDRLLSLLRQRADLLELTSLRLHWDSLRWQIMQETAKVRSEIDEIARVKGRWVAPPVHHDKSRDHRLSEITRLGADATSVGSPMGHRDSLLTASDSSTSLTGLAQGSPSLVTPSKSCKRESMSSPSSNFNGNSPKRNFHLPLLHSSIVNLEIRQRNLASTLLSRSGKVLDSMIDLAIPLKDLGGIHGPTTEDQSGAVPDELLDVQEDLEGDVGTIARTIAWCKEVEVQWKLADAHHSASSRAIDVASGLMDDIDMALTRPATDVEHKRLMGTLTRGRNHLPESIDSTFPHPTNIDYPEFDVHSSNLSIALTTFHNEARAAIAKCEDGLAWYARLAEAANIVTSAKDNVDRVRLDLLTQCQTIEQTGEATGRPRLDDFASLEETVPAWLDSLPDKLSKSRHLVDDALSMNQRLTLGELKYRQIAKAIPKSWRDRLTDPRAPNAVDDAESASGEVLRLVDRLRASANEADMDALILPVLRAVIARAATLRDHLSKLNKELYQISDHPSIDALDALHRYMETNTREDHRAITSGVHEIGRILRDQQRDFHPILERLFTLRDGLKQEIEAVQERMGTLIALEAQRRTVDAVEIEANKLEERVVSAQSLLDRTLAAEVEVGMSLELPGKLRTTLDEIVGDAHSWTEGLVKRVPFVAPDSTSAEASTTSLASTSSSVVLGTAPTRRLLPSVTWTATPLMTPPETPPDTPQLSVAVASKRTGTCRPNLAQSDARARQKVNEVSCRVQSALTRLQRSAETFEVDRWQAHTTRLIRQSEHASEKVTDWVRKAQRVLAEIGEVRLITQDCGGLQASLESVDSLRKRFEGARLRSDIEELAQTINLHLGYVTDSKVGLQSTEYTTKHLRSALTMLDTIRGEVERAYDEVDVYKNRLARELQQAMARRDKSTSKPLAPPAVSHSEASDVFGTIAAVTTKSTSDLDGVALRTLSQRIYNMDLGQVVRPSSELMRTTPSHRQIPTAEYARRIIDDLQAFTNELADFASASAGRDEDAIMALRASHATACAHIGRLESLASVSTAVRACDEAFSRLLDRLDHHAESRETKLESLRGEAEFALNALRHHALALSDDSRVVSEAKRVEATWAELEMLTKEALHPDIALADGSLDLLADTSSIASSQSTTFRRPLSRPGYRIASNSPLLPISLFAEPRSRAASDTPSRVRVDSMRSGLPRLRKSSMGLFQSTSPTRAGTSIGRSSIPRPKRLTQDSISGGMAATPPGPSLTPRARTSNSVSTASSESRKSLVPEPKTFIGSASMNGGHGPCSSLSRKAYIADPKSKLDMAVEKIVNKLQVNIPIRPVGMDRKEDWKDQSGKYWIGAEGRAKLCFCRILRSKTVMVRVGGGWVELSKFIMDHFADTLTEWNPANAVTGTSAPVPITSGSLDTPRRPRSSLSQQSSVIYDSATPRLAPVHTSAKVTSLPTPIFLTPQRSRYRDCETTPGQHVDRSGTEVGTGPITPLIPLHFIRKASESPPVRQKEKEKFGAGKRSILGRSASGQNMTLSNSTPSPEQVGDGTGS